jgi:ribonucleotide reductase beta subunit family protein with ferritin-like domain
MQKSDQQQEHATPVMDIADKLPEKYIVFSENYRIVCFGRDWSVIESQQNTCNNLKNNQECRHSAKTEGAVEFDG